MLDGRVKTLHPKVHGGLLGAPRRADAHGGAARARHRARSTCWSSTSIRSRRPSRKPGCTLDDAIENIDIGGPAMVRSAAKNWKRRRACSTDASQYAGVARRAEGTTARSRRRRASRSRSPRSTASRNYDARDQRLPVVARTADGVAQRRVPGAEQRPLRQAAGPALRREPAPAAPRSTATCTRRPARSSRARQLQGKELSYNNIADADAAWECVQELRRAGLRDRQARQPVRRRASAPTAPRPTRRRFKTDPTSAFGGIIAFNRDGRRAPRPSASPSSSSRC